MYSRGVPDQGMQGYCSQQMTWRMLSGRGEGVNEWWQGGRFKGPRGRAPGPKHRRYSAAMAPHSTSCSSQHPAPPPPIDQQHARRARAQPTPRQKLDARSSHCSLLSPVCPNPPTPCHWRRPLRKAGPALVATCTSRLVRIRLGGALRPNPRAALTCFSSVSAPHSVAEREGSRSKMDGEVDGGGFCVGGERGLAQGMA